MLPLSADMPVEFTDNMCKEEIIFKNTIGRLKGIVLSATMAEQILQAMPAALKEIVLSATLAEQVQQA